VADKIYLIIGPIRVGLKTEARGPIAFPLSHIIRSIFPEHGSITVPLPSMKLSGVFDTTLKQMNEPCGGRSGEEEVQDGG
jgi:hypothetical protein